MPDLNVIFDATRLATRLFRPTPNGIDRVDLAYALNFLRGDETPASGALFGLGGMPRLLPAHAALAVSRFLEARWRETIDPASDLALLRLLAELRCALPANQAVSPAGRHSARAQLPAAAANLTRFGLAALMSGRSMAAHAPKGAVYLNVSQFPIWLPRYLSWLDDRPDVRAVFFLHDLLPLQYPEFFRPFEVRRHQGRARAIADRAAAVIVASAHTADALRDHLRRVGRPIPPILVAPLPVASEFSAGIGAPTASADRVPYFVTIGTIEPRKNHLLLLNVWRELAQRQGGGAPRLVLAGSRGWENENVIDMLDRSKAIRELVIEVKGLASPALATLLAGASALLMPSFAEGFGLPIAEARALGVPVIASDIPVFREVFAGAGVQLIDPLDGMAWMRAIEACPAPDAVRRCSSSGPSTKCYFRNVREFLRKAA